MRRFFLSFAVFLLTSLCGLAQNRTHVVQAGETLYSISRSYGLTVDELRAANPAVGETIVTGQSLSIPATGAQTAAPSSPQIGKVQTQCKQMYLVEKKETIYSITHKFGITEEEFRAANPDIKKDKVKKGQYVCIPYSAAEREAMAKQQAEEQARREAEEQRKAEEQARRARVKSTVNVAVILPFNLDDAKKSKEAVKMLDFYEGFLLGVEEQKAKGVNINLYAYDEKSTFANGIDSLLATPMMAHQDLIVGPMRREHIPTLSRYAREHHIVLAVPFSTHAASLAPSPALFQVNTQTSDLYKEVYDAFLEKHAKANVVFLYQADDKDAHAGYIIGFKNAMRERGIAYRTASMSDLTNLSAVLDSIRPNVIVPSASSQTAFEKMAHQLEKANALSKYRISLFGYPEWQTYKEANTRLLRKYDASFYATFHTNLQASGVQAFDRKFQSWFKREQSPTVPRYGLLGCDVARYFIGGIHEYGNEFAKHQQEYKAAALQNPMRFRYRNGAYINTSIHIIHL